MDAEVILGRFPIRIIRLRPFHSYHADPSILALGNRVRLDFNPIRNGKMKPLEFLHDGRAFIKFFISIGGSKFAVHAVVRRIVTQRAHAPN